MTVGIVGRGRMGRALAEAVRHGGGHTLLVPGRADPARAAELLNGLPVSLPIAADHPSALRDVFALAHALGFAPLDAGDIRAARHLEALAGLLMAISDRQGLRGRVSIHIGVPSRDRLAREPACRAG